MADVNQVTRNAVVNYLNGFANSHGGGYVPSMPVHHARAKVVPLAVPQDKQSSEPAFPKLQLSDEALKKLAEQINRVMSQFNRQIQVRTFQPTGQMYVQIVDQTTDEVVKTIPAEDALELAMKIDKAVGLLIDKKK